MSTTRKKKLIVLPSMMILGLVSYATLFNAAGITPTTVLAAVLVAPLWIFMFWFIITEPEVRL